MSDPTRIGSHLYTFITTTPNEPTGSGTRGIINSHIAKISHRRRQRRSNGEPHNLSYALGRTVDVISFNPVLPYCLICSQSSLRTWPPGPCPHILKRMPVMQSMETFQQGSVLAHGNSDPFNSFPIKIDATANFLLDFARESCIPQVVRRNERWSTDKRNTRPRRQPPSKPQEVCQDLCLGYLFLARYAALAVSLKNEDRRIEIACMKYKGTASALLRMRIADRINTPNLEPTDLQTQGSTTNAWLVQVCWLIYMLSTVELSTRNYREAAIHTNMILNFMYSDDPATKVVLGLDFLNAIAFWDVQRASITLSRPSFDPERWATEYLQTSWESLVQLQALAPMKSVSVAEVDEESNTQLISVWPFGRIREIRNIARTLPMLPVESNLEATRLHFSVWNSIHEARLLNNILDMPKDAGCLSAPTAAYMACLYWLRRSLSAESFGSSENGEQCTTLYDAGPAILREFSAIHERERKAPRANSRVAGGMQTGSPQHYHNNVVSQHSESKLRLWVLYVAAMVQGATTASERPQQFAIEFLKQARAMRYTSWCQVRDDALKMFLYDDEIDPGGDLWYSQVMNIP